MTPPTTGQRWPRAKYPTVQQAGSDVVTSAEVVNYASNAVVTDVDGVATIDVTGGGGGGGGILPDQPPVSPTVYDDEFDGSVLDAKWTTDSAPGGGLTEQFAFMGTLLRLLSPGESSSNFWVFSQPITTIGAAGTRFWVTCKLGLSSRGLTDLEICNFEVGNNASYAGGTYLDVNLENDGSGNYKVSTYNGTEHGVTSLGPALGGVYLHFQRNAANDVRAYVSLDGIAWREFYTASSVTFDVDFLFFRLYGSTTATHNSIHWIDWVRINDPRFDQGF